MEEQLSKIFCKICLLDNDPNETYEIQKCGCVFCKTCLEEYLRFQIKNGAYVISCLDSKCQQDGSFSWVEIEKLTDEEIFRKHKEFHLKKEVDLDPRRAWCPEPNCDTICKIEFDNPGWTFFSCQSCKNMFCSQCPRGWHVGKYTHVSKP